MNLAWPSKLDPYQKLAVVAYHVAVVALFVVHRPWAYHRLLFHHETTTTHHLTAACHDHGRVDYDFVVYGRRYTGDTYGMGSRCTELQPGDTLTITFDPDDPTTNTDGSPRTELASRLREIGIWLFFATVVLGMILFDRSPSRSEADRSG
jgi:hypothetical protein